MASLNQANIIGYVGDEPRIATTQSGRKMATFSIATTEKGFTRQDGTVVPDKTEWHNIVTWGKTAEVVEKCVHKGSLLFVQGKLATRPYEKDGQRRYVTEIVVDVMQLLDRKPNDVSQQQVVNTPRNDEDKDLPF